MANNVKRPSWGDEPTHVTKAKRDIRYVQALGYAWGRSDTDQGQYQLNAGVETLAFAEWYADSNIQTLHAAYQGWKAAHHLISYPDPVTAAEWH